jgi:hypothetical protein
MEKKTTFNEYVHGFLCRKITTSDMDRRWFTTKITSVQ